jgi:hypothetical protein
MTSIKNLLADLDEKTIAQRIGIPHDEARMRYSLRSNTIGSFEEFTGLIADYYTKHFTACVSHGGTLSASEAASRAKELLEREYRRRGGDIVTAYNDAHDGTNGGLRLILDTIAEGLKAESVERYIRDAFDRYVEPNSWEQKVEIIRQFIAQCGVNLAPSIQADQPERYASNYRELVQSYVTALQRTSSIFRRL